MKKIILFIIILILFSNFVIAQEEKSSSEKGLSDILIQTTMSAGRTRLTSMISKGIGQSENGQLLLNLYNSRNDLKQFAVNLAKSKACSTETASQMCKTLETAQSMISSGVDPSTFVSTVCSLQQGGELCDTVNKATSEYNKYKAMGQNPMGSLQGFMMSKVTEKISPELGKGLQYYHMGKGLIDKVKAGPGALGKSLLQQQISSRISGTQPTSPLASLTGMSIREVSLNLEAEGINTNNCLLGFNINGNFGNIHNCRIYTDNSDISLLLLGLSKEIPSYQLIAGEACNLYRKNGITVIYPDLSTDASQKTTCTLKFEDQRGEQNLKTFYSGYNAVEQKVELDFEQIDIPEIVKRQLLMISEDVDITLRSGTFVFDSNNRLIYTYLKPVEDTIYDFYGKIRIKVPADSTLIYISGKIYLDSSLVKKPEFTFYRKLGTDWESNTIHSAFLPVKISYMPNNHVELKGDKFVITSDTEDRTMTISKGTIEFNSFEDFIVSGTEVLVTDKGNMFGIRTIKPGSNVNVKGCTYAGSKNLEYLTSSSNLVTYCTDQEDFFLKGTGKDYELNIDGKIKYEINSGSLIHHKNSNNTYVEAFGDILLKNSALPLRYVGNKIQGLIQSNEPRYDISPNNFKLNNFYGAANYGTLCTGFDETFSLYCGAGNLLLTLNEEKMPKKSITENILNFNYASYHSGEYCSIWFDGIKLNSKNVYARDNILILDIKGVYYALTFSGYVGYIDQGRFVPYTSYINDKGILIEENLIIPNQVINYLNSIASKDELIYQNYFLDACPDFKDYYAEMPEDCYFVNGLCLLENKLMLGENNCWRSGYFET